MVRVSPPSRRLSFQSLEDRRLLAAGAATKSPPVAVSDTYEVAGNIRLQVDAAHGLLRNDTDSDGPFPPILGTDLKIKPGSIALISGGVGGSLAAGDDGSFTYDPPVGFQGTELWQYELVDGTGEESQSLGFVEFSIVGMTWFVDNSAPGGGTGTLTNPFSNFSELDGFGDVDQPGESIFVFQGTGFPVGSLTLEDDQQLIGEGVGLTHAGIPAGGRPTLNGVQLASNNTVQGFHIEANTGVGLQGNTFGTAAIRDISLTVTGTARAIDLDSGAGSFVFDSISATNTDRDVVKLTTVSGSVTVLDGNIQNISGDAIVVQNGSNLDLTLIVTGLHVKGDTVAFATTNNALRVQLLSSARLDLIVVDNVAEYLNQSAVRIAMQDTAQAQLRIDHNEFAHLNTAAAVDLQLQGSSNAAVYLDTNSISLSQGGGVRAQAADTSKLRAILKNTTLQSVGGDGITISTPVASLARINALVANNKFLNVAQTGLLVDIQGGAQVDLTATGNTFTSNNTAGGTHALDVRSADTATLRTDIRSNTVTSTSAGSFRLAQSGTSSLRIATSLTSASAQLTFANTTFGFPVAVVGGVLLASPGAFNSAVPLLLGDFIWSDVNENGLQEVGETGLAGIAVRVIGTESGTGTQVDRTTVSDPNGHYYFVGLLPGSYSVSLTVPDKYRISPALQGNDRSRDSNFSPSSKTTNTTLTAATDALGVDAGMAYDPAIGAWQNPANQFDIDNDRDVDVADAIIVVSNLLIQGTRRLTAPSAASSPPPFIDVDGDGDLDVVDALLVINYLLGHLQSSAPETRVAASPLPSETLKSVQQEEPEATIDWDLLAIGSLFESESKKPGKS